MGQGPGRNDPCLCGSGKKYKKCCLAANRAQTDGSHPPGRDPRPHFARQTQGVGQIYYLPGAADMGYGCWPCVSCYCKAAAGQEDKLLWAMAHPEREYQSRKKGLRAAEAELEVAFAGSGVLSPDSIAVRLKGQGFTPMGEFHVAPDWETDRKTALGDKHVEPFGEGAAQGDPKLYRMMMQTVDNQLAENDPPETRQTMERLLKEGHPQKLCRRLIGLAVVIELSEMNLFKKPFNRQRFVENLEKLPETPEFPFAEMMGQRGE